MFKANGTFRLLQRFSIGILSIFTYFYWLHTNYRFQWLYVTFSSAFPFQAFPLHFSSKNQIPFSPEKRPCYEEISQHQRDHSSRCWNLANVYSPANVKWQNICYWFYKQRNDLANALWINERVHSLRSP